MSGPGAVGSGAAGDRTGALATVLAEARDLGLLGPGPIERHVAHALGFADAATAAGLAGGPRRFLDLGSGGGLPGLVLALRWTSSRATLLDAGGRRAAFLERSVAACGLGDRVVVVHARAEQAGRDPAQRGAYDLVVARSFGPPAVTAECAAPFLAPAGLLVTSEPPGTGPAAGAGRPGDPGAGAGPGRWPSEGLAQLGLVPVTTVSGEFSYHAARLEAPVPDRFPRRVGVAAKRPLF